MIFNFSDFSLFESRGFPKSLINPSNFIFDFISSKIDWWVNRKGPANYSEEFVFWEDEFGFEKDPDFPIKRFKLKLKILVDDKLDLKTISGLLFDMKWSIFINFSKLSPGIKKMYPFGETLQYHMILI